MTVTIGTDPFRYRVEENWAKLPEGWSFQDVAAVAVDKQDRVYVFNRGEHPIIVLDRGGKFLRSWGEGIFRRAHGLHVGPDESIYCTDDFDHTVRKCTLDGKVLLTLGEPGKPAPFMSGRPFCQCTHTALSPTGEIYVTDGYKNAHVHKYSPDGKLLLSWGGPGCSPGQFNVPHNICCDADGWVYVADRENHRVQVFDGNGKYETQWNNLHRPNGMFMTGGKCPLCYIGEGGPTMNVNRAFPNLGSMICILDLEGNPLARLGGPRPGRNPGQFMSPHGITVDSHGDIYVGEVAYTAWPMYVPDEPVPESLRTLQKLVKV
jgi:DNA-binding beta-propeller fold protein YncE